jgi:hypothetical protein
MHINARHHCCMTKSNILFVLVLGQAYQINIEAKCGAQHNIVSRNIFAKHIIVIKVLKQTKKVCLMADHTNPNSL